MLEVLLVHRRRIPGHTSFACSCLTALHFWEAPPSSCTPELQSASPARQWLQPGHEALSVKPMSALHALSSLLPLQRCCRLHHGTCTGACTDTHAA